MFILIHRQQTKHHPHIKNDSQSQFTPGTKESSSYSIPPQCNAEAKEQQQDADD